MGALQQFIFVPVLSLLPCVLWLWYFSSRTRYKRPSVRVLGITFLLGALATLPALLLNLAGQSFLINIFGKTSWSHLLVLIFVVGPVEEAIKLLVVYFYAYRQQEFDEALDGVTFSATAALGFAAIENVVYLAQSDPMLVLLRGPLSNPGHALFSAVWGMSLSRAKTQPNLFNKRFPIILEGWIYASLLHSLFDVLLVAASRVNIIFFGLLVALMILLFFRIRARIRFHSETSPHREGTLVLPTRRYCQECGAKGATGMQCPECGAFIPDPEELELCPICTTPQRPGAKFCARCGANIKLPAKENLDSRPHFVTVNNNGEERIAYILNENEILIGRTLNNGFVIEHPSVSKRHARVVAEQENYALYDLGSSNGTFVNGKRINETKLEDGCEVRFGRAHFIYRAQQETATEESSAQ
ncbi:MAG TPA: PrsW family glutamic-type intramembrane protease [Blastocatellia bacterium]|nr:PrsW family glutamic-type intramembrane protease [Blastocatellia bacterium]HMV86028.1 PrsW family glutamic-type intramembrane protease [Blastocatellia bacterium]HMX25290.1 PrsW family glutamic-type intramembrane protease [Blastocatellia bacterium]HMY70585.1 PrsW family glutamic-type intramembrane protease [Blastocatellia bacterium]HMZ23033.1 PrsW family glutamic-type intramembrane protease [Blastocatellia bacterium]